jgi:hypothetical protein
MSLPGFVAECALCPTAAAEASGWWSSSTTPAAAVLPAVSEPFCHRGLPNCMSDCLRRCVDPGGFCNHNCACCCTGHTAGCFM